MDFDYDVFLSYASEDGDSAAAPLAEALKRRSLRVWFDREQMPLGAGVGSSLDRGLAASRFVVALFSEPYLRKNWTTKERDGALAKESAGDDRLLPVLHGIALERLRELTPLTAGRVCATMGDGLEHVADRIAHAVRRVRTYRVFLVSTLLAESVERQRLLEALQGAGMEPVPQEPPSAVAAAAAAQSGAELTVVVLAHRYGAALAGDPEQRSLSAWAIGAEARPDRLLVLAPHASTPVVPEADFDRGPSGVDYARQGRLQALRSGVGAAAVEYARETLAATLRSKLVAWREAREPEAPAADATAPAFGFDADVQRYLETAVRRYASVELAGFESKLRVPIRIEDLFVPLNAVPGRAITDTAQSAEEAADRFGERTEELPLTEAFWRGDATCKRTGLVLLGDPGAGKTTHLKRVLLWVAAKGPESLGLPAGTFPLFLPLRELKSADEDLAAFLKRALGREGIDVGEEFAAALVQHRRLLLLLDGLDEIHDEELRASAARWIALRQQANGEARFLVSCRYAGYEAARLPGEFLELHLRPMNKAQAEDFVRRWYKIVEIATAEAADDPAAKADAERLATERAGKLLQRLQQADVRAAARVFQLTRNPLLLTAICLVHRDKGELPKHRADLYDDCVDVLLEHWRRKREIPVDVPARTAREILKPLAAWMHERDGRERASAAEIAPVIGPELERTRLGMDAEEFLRTIQNQSGLLTGWGPDLFGFMHLGFQEYLAAQALRDRAIQDPGEWRRIAQRFGPSWWREVVVLLLADSACFEPLFREVVRTRAFGENLDLVRECFTDGARASSAPFEELLRPRFLCDLLALLLGRRADLRQRQEAAAAVLREFDAEALRRTGWQERAAKKPARPLRSSVSDRGGVELIWIPAGFWLGKYAVTNEEYGRYLQDQPDVREPELWGDKRFNGPRQPVVGVSWDEAQAFCAWAGGRLPTSAEWELACRASTTTEYSFGDDPSELPKYAWFRENADGRTHPVGEKLPNPFGLFDMHGNVWEWCSDALRKSGADRVIRGGSFRNTAWFARSANRWWSSPGLRGNYLGFRLAASPSPHLVDLR